MLQLRGRFDGRQDPVEELSLRSLPLGKEIHSHLAVERRLEGVVDEDATFLAEGVEEAGAVDLPARGRKILGFLEDQEGVAYLYGRLILERAPVHLFAVEQGPVGGAEILDMPAARYQDGLGVFARAAVVIEADLGIFTPAENSWRLAGKDGEGFPLILSFSYA